MSKKFQYSCGCSFDVVESNNDQTHIIFDPTIEHINLDCIKTWNLISDGNTKGCFQLESRLGRSTAKKLKPENIEQLSALIAIIRPGCIAGDTKISVSTYDHKDGVKRQKRVKMRDLYKNKSNYSTTISYDENTGKFVQNKIKNVFYNGKKKCFRVVINTSSNMNSVNGLKQYNLECTDDHQLLTSKGWKELKDIKIGERILVNKRKSTRQIGLGDKSFRTKCYHAYEHRCLFCDWNNGSLDVNHIIENRYDNNEISNLCFMCPNHHREFTQDSIKVKEIRRLQKIHKLPKTIDGKWATLIEKIPVGTKDVYDISMESPHHNFIAGDIIVHNCLEAIREGKSVTNHYIDKKNGMESIDYFHPSLESSLKTTYGEMIYQEQAMQIARDIAGFNLQEADMLRKAIGKKKPEEMAKVKKTFIEGSKNQNIVSSDQAEEIFGWIEKSQRYSFNKSHSVSYAINAYLSAYTKAHFPKVFFASYLRFAKDKIDPKAEIKELVQNAREMDIEVSIPDIRNVNELFIMKNNKIYFGLTDIKGFGKSVYNKLVSIKKDKNLDFDTINWLEMMILVLANINSTAAKSLIQSGALYYFTKTRSSMLFELGLVSELTKKECDFILLNILKYKTLGDALYDLYHNGKSNKNRKAIILGLINNNNKPPYSLDDNPEWISDTEDSILGCSITCSKVDMYDITMTNMTCKEFKNTLMSDNILLCGEIESIGITKTKNGKNPGLEMAFVTLSDGTGLLDSVIFFPESYKANRNVLFEGNVIIVKGSKSKTGDSLIVDKAYIPRT